MKLTRNKQKIKDLSDQNNKLRFWNINGIEYEEIECGINKDNIWYVRIRNNSTKEVKKMSWDNWRNKVK